MGGFVEKYSTYNWIKVRRHVDNPYLPLDERFKRLEQHHIEETTFLIEEVRKLALILDAANISLTP